MAEKTSDNANPTARGYYQKAMAALERNNLDYAVEMFQQALAIEPNFLNCRKYLRAAQMKRSESQGSLKRAMISATSQAKLAKARMALSKNPVEAMNLAEQVLSDDPKNTQALATLAEGAEAAKFPETTVQTLEHLTTLSPRDSKALHWLARTYTSVQKHDKARDIYERILQVNPNDFEAQKGIKDATADGAMHEGKWEDAKSYRDVMKDKDGAVALEQQSRVVRADEMVDNLIRESLAKLAKEPGNPLIERELGKLYGQKGDHETALKYLEKLFAAEGGTDPALEKEIGELKNARLESKIEEKRKLLATKPGDVTLQEQIAVLEAERLKLELAETQRLVERYPNELMYRYDLGVLLMQTGDIGGAIEQFQKSNGHPQRRVASLNYLGQCFNNLGMPDMAVDSFQTAIKEQPMMDGLKKDLIYNLGLTFEAMGDFEKATTEYKKIAAVDFGFRDVKAKLTRKPPPKTA